MKLVAYFSFLSPFTYYLLLLVVQAEKEWTTEMWLGYFQTQFLFPSLQLFREVECLSQTSKIAVLSIKMSIEIWEFLFDVMKPIFSGMRRLAFLSEAFREVVIFVSIYFILCLSYFIVFSIY